MQYKVKSMLICFRSLQDVQIWFQPNAASRFAAFLPHSDSQDGFGKSAWIYTYLKIKSNMLLFLFVCFFGWGGGWGSSVFLMSNISLNSDMGRVYVSHSLLYLSVSDQESLNP